MSRGVFWGVCELSMTLGSLSADGYVCVPAMFIVCCEVSSAGSCWQLGGAQSWIQTEASMSVLGD